MARRSQVRARTPRPRAPAAPPATGPVYTVELGVACNNNCRFCPQAIMRHGLGRSLELRTEDVLGHLRRARAAGYRRLGLIGGEPTVRPDLVELVGQARSLGFTEISITTNARRFAYAPYARQLVRAGLTNASVSIHGPDARRHDSLTRAPGSFAQGLAGLDTLRAEAATAGVELHLQSITLVCRRTLPWMADTVRLLGAHGAQLHILQPFVIDVRLLPLSDSLLADRDEILDAVRAAAAAAAEHGGRIKLFNFPPCLLADVGDRLELQGYHRTTERRPDIAVTARGDEGRDPMCRPLAECDGCPQPGCDGLRVELVPQRELRAEIEGALAAHAGRHGRREVWLGALELLDTVTAAAVLAAARARFARVVLITSGLGRAGSGIVHAAARAGVAGLWLVCDPGEPWQRDRLPRDGNLAVCGELATLARNLGITEVRFVVDALRLMAAERLLELPAADLEVDLMEFAESGPAVLSQVKGCYQRLAERAGHHLRLVGETGAVDPAAARRFLAHPLTSRRILWTDRLMPPSLRPLCVP